MRPDPLEGLSPAAADVRHALEDLAREHPEASAPALVLELARRYIQARPVSVHVHAARVPPDGRETA